MMHIMHYDDIRQIYRPKHITLLFIAESPPPEDSSIPSSRHFYRSDVVRSNDRLFTNTIRALYPETAELPEKQIQENKEQWLQRFSKDGRYMIEALEESQPHEITKKERQARITNALPRLLQRVKALADKDTKLILIKSNVFDVAAKPLKQAGYLVLNTELVDYPGRFNQKAYREKLAQLTALR